MSRSTRALLASCRPDYLGAEEELADDRHAKEGFGLLAAAGLEVQLVVQDSDRDIGVEQVPTTHPRPPARSLPR